jgi:hypothetical protein
MASEGAIPGRYNIVLSDEYETFDRQVPVEEFIEMLRDDEVPDKLCVVGLEDAFGDGTAEELATEIRDKKDQLENQHPLPTVQFEIEGSLQRVGKGYDLRYGDEILDLNEVFGSPLDREGDGWVVAHF